MSHHKSREVVLPIRMTPELQAALDAMRETWRRDPAAVPRGLTCSQSREGAFVMTAAESVFVTLSGACVVKGLGAIELVSDKGTKAGFSADLDVGSRLSALTWEKGVIVRCFGNAVIGFAPALCCSDSEMDMIFERVEGALDALLEMPDIRAATGCS